MLYNEGCLPDCREKCFADLLKPDLFHPRDLKHLNHFPPTFQHGLHQPYQISNPGRSGLWKDSIMFNICCSVTHARWNLSSSAAQGETVWVLLTDSAHCRLLIRNKGSTPPSFNVLTRLHFLPHAFFREDKRP